MKWYSGKGNSLDARKYKSGLYYYTNTEPWYEIFVSRTWTGKRYLNRWRVYLVKDKHTTLKSFFTDNYTDVKIHVNTLKKYAESYHITYHMRRKR